MYERAQTCARQHRHAQSSLPPIERQWAVLSLGCWTRRQAARHDSRICNPSETLGNDMKRVNGPWVRMICQRPGGALERRFDGA